MTSVTLDTTTDTEQFEGPTLVPADVLFGLDKQEQLNMQSLYESLFYIVEHSSRRSLGIFFGAIAGALLYCLPIVAKLPYLNPRGLGLGTECLLLLISMALGAFGGRWAAGVRYREDASLARRQLIEIIDDGANQQCSDAETHNEVLEALLRSAYQYERLARSDYRKVIETLYREAGVKLIPPNET